MSIVFSDTTTNLGIVQQVRSFMRVDSTQYPTYKIVNSLNNYLDTVTGYAIGADRRFQWDDTNHTKLPEGTAPLTINVSDYSFLTDEQGNIFWLDKDNRVLVGTDGVYLDITLNDHLLMEGEARELTRKVAQLRKTLGLKQGDAP